MKLDKELAEKCKEIRKNNNITINKMSKILGVKVDTIKKYENGVLRVPTDILWFYVELANGNANINKN